VNEYDYYRILGVDREATAVVIQQAYEALIAHIPAELRTTDNPTYQRIISAYEVVSDPSRRATYDSLLIETGDPILKIAVQASREKVPILGSPQLLYLLIDIRPP
jgi:DnaJ-class molecular chaperone